MPPLPPEAAEKPFSRCAVAMNLAGLTEIETDAAVKAVLEVGSKGDELASALEYVAAQVRGSVRAGTVTEGDVMLAAGDEQVDAALLVVTTKLVDGARSFVRLQSSRRPLCAAMVEECDNFDPDTVRAYALGKYSYGKIDGLARQRCGPCRGKFVRRESLLQVRFVGSAGALAGLGLARAGNAEDIDPNATKTYAVYTSRSRLDPSSARLGV
ncbi:MAG: hypothetical protein U1E22_08500, partial [Coriobacteriia bacterium]|nr:hypothetical protein [Coriobacteriia bacterium]